MEREMIFRSFWAQDYLAMAIYLNLSAHFHTHGTDSLQVADRKLSNVYYLYVTGRKSRHREREF